MVDRSNQALILNGPARFFATFDRRGRARLAVQAPAAAASYVNPNTVSVSQRLNDSLSMNCLNSSVSSLSTAIMTRASALSFLMNSSFGRGFEPAGFENARHPRWRLSYSQILHVRVVSKLGARGAENRWLISRRSRQ